MAFAGPESADEDGMAIFTAILGWQFPLRSLRKEQGMEGGEDSVDSRVWAENFARFGPQVIGRTMFDFGYPNWGENPPFHAPVFVVTHRGQERISKSGGTSYTFVTNGVAAAVEQARGVAGGKGVLVADGVSIAQQALAAGLVDEVVLHAVPKLVGRGVRLFGAGEVDLRCIETIEERSTCATVLKRFQLAAGSPDEPRSQDSVTRGATSLRRVPESRRRLLSQRRSRRRSPRSSRLLW